MISCFRNTLAAASVVAIATSAAPTIVRADPGTVTIEGVVQYIPRGGDGRPATMTCSSMSATAFVRGANASETPYTVGPIADDVDRSASACRFRITGVPAGVPLLFSVTYGYRNAAGGRWAPIAAGTTYKTSVTIHQAPPCDGLHGGC
jgi:hypothetical protein